MQLLKLSDSVNFMRLRFPAMVLSTLLILGSFVSLGVNSLNWGLDFTSRFNPNCCQIVSYFGFSIFYKSYIQFCACTCCFK